MRRVCTQCGRDEPTVIFDPGCERGVYCNFVDPAAAVVVATTDGREVGLVVEAVRKFADSDDWVILRLAELRAAGERATARVVFAPHAIGMVFAVQVRRADGTIETSKKGEG